MLQKVQQGRLTRRTLLRGLSLGAGILALGGLSGCTQFLKRSGSSVPLAPAGASNARQRLAQLAREAKEAWKEVLRDYNQWRRTGDKKVKLELPEKIRKAKRFTLDVADGSDAEGLTAKLNEALAQANSNKGNAIEEVMKDLKDAGLSSNEAQELEQALKQANPVAGRGIIIKYGGITSYTRYLLGQDTNALGGSFTGLALSSCDIVTFVCVVGTLSMVTAAILTATEVDNWLDLSDPALISLAAILFGLELLLDTCGGSGCSARDGGGGNKDNNGEELTPQGEQ